MLTKEQQQNINASKYCLYCGAQVAHGKGWIAVGQCFEHRKMWEDDIKFGLSKRNRLKEIQAKIDLQTQKGNQLILNI